MTGRPYDPTIYRGCAEHYVRGRAPYSRSLGATLAAETGLDGSGRLLDVGCGPGVLALELAGQFEQVVGLDPDAGMLAEAARRSAAGGISHVRWVQGLAEAIGELDLGTFKLVTFGQSFHWTDRERVAEAVFECIEPGGALVLIAHEKEGRPQPAGPDHPQIPDDAIRALIGRYLGTQRRAGQGYAAWSPERYEVTLARTRFGAPRTIYCAGRPDIVRDVDGVVASYLSMSFAAPHLFGGRLDEFQLELRDLLASCSPTGLFWDWPGDTALLIAGKAG